MRWLIALLVLSAPVQAMPVVPNFRTGTMTSRTESTTQVTESIRSVDFATGYTYSASGLTSSTQELQFSLGRAPYKLKPLTA